MENKMLVNTAKHLIVGLVMLSGINHVNAEVQSHSKDIVVELPSDLPEMAQRQGQAMYLHDTTDGRTFLYVEQRHGGRLVVFDVTDPAKLKAVASVIVKTPSAFDFVRPLGDSAELIRYRNGAGVAVLDLHIPKAPAIKAIGALRRAGHTEPIGETGFLMVNEPYTFINPVPRDYQVVETSNPAAPALLITVKMVRQKLTNESTGTVYLLGTDGLTVVRRTRVEAEHAADLMQQTGN